MRHDAEVRAERKAGELLAQMPKAQGTDYGGRQYIDGNNMLPSNPPPTLSDLGIEKMQSSRWQTLAEMPEEEFERHLNESQRALIAAKLANMMVGGDRPSEKDLNFDSANLPNGISQSEAAEILNVSPRMIATSQTANLESGGTGANQFQNSRSANLQTCISQSEAAEILNVSPRMIATSQTANLQSEITEILNVSPRMIATAYRWPMSIPLDSRCILIKTKRFWQARKHLPEPDQTTVRGGMAESHYISPCPRWIPSGVFR